MNCSVCCEHHNVSTSFFSVFPAGAGVIPVDEATELMEVCFPRRCGGDPIPIDKAERLVVFSPQVRG